MSSRRQDRRQQERRARALKTHRAAVAPKGKASLLARMSTDWIAAGIIGGVVLIIAAVFASAYFAGPDRSPGNPTFAQVFSVAVNPARPTTALLGDAKGLFISNDSGKKWTPHTITDPVRKVYYDPNHTNVAYVVGGATIQQSTDGGDSWKAFPTNLPQGRVTAMASDPADSSKVYAFVSGQGLYKSENSGATWDRQNPLSQATLTSLAVKAGAPDTVYAFHDTDGFIVSKDNGKRFDTTGGSTLPRKAVSDILTFAKETSTLFAAADQALYKSTDGGSSWTKLDAPAIHGLALVALSRDPSSGKLYATNALGTLFVSPDGGTTWKKGVV